MNSITINETINPLHSEISSLINDTENVSKQLRNSEYCTLEDYRNCNNWINKQLLCNRAKYLLLDISSYEIKVPDSLSLNLIFKILIENGADVNIKGNWGRTPLHLALKKGYTNLAKLLIEHGADVNATDNKGWTPLHYAAKNGHTECITTLNNLGVDVNAKCNDGWTPLHLASYYGYIEIAQLLIEKGANIKLLITHGADVNAKTNDGNTPLHYAAANGHTEITQLLIEKGADVNAKNNEERTPFHSALRYNYPEIATILKIVNHLDNNDSIDTLTSDIENLTADEIKGYYNENKDQIESLMDKRTKALIKKAITDLNEDISIAIIKRGKDFIKDLCEVRPLKELCAIELQKHFTKDDDDPYYNELKTYPDILQKIFFKSYTPLLTLSDEQITCAQNLLKKLNS